jgi:hypothetical protein
LGENESDAYQTGFQELGTFLEKAGRRWKVGEKYIGMARFHDVSEDKEF